MRNIVNISRHVPHSVSHVESRDTFEEEEISFIFQKIKVEWSAGGTSASDDWIAST